jgi:hypothetical protein
MGENIILFFMMIVYSEMKTGTTKWETPSDLQTSAFSPMELQTHLSTHMNKRARCTGWRVNEVSGVPLRFTMVHPNANRAINRRTFDEYVVKVNLMVATIDQMSGGMGPPLRPASIDLTVYLWDQKKTLLEDDVSIDVRTANSGFTIISSAGCATVFVFREEESLKTLMHEILHCYDFGNWANTDEEVLDLCEGALEQTGVKVSCRLKPAEAIVDAMAIKLMHDMFGGAHWPSCVEYADMLKNKLLHHFGAQWKQTTAAAEYYLLKLIFMGDINVVLSAHQHGLQHPNKAKMRRLIRKTTRARSAQSAQSAHVDPLVYPLSMRMTPREMLDR